MAFNADFWLASATIAPVIALAAVVAYKDTIATTGEIFGLSREPRAGQTLTDATAALQNALFSGTLAVYNCLGQTFTLALALTSLALRANVAPFWSVIVIES